MPYEETGRMIETYDRAGVDLLFIDCREPQEISRFVNDYNATTLLVRRGQQKSFGNHADDNVEAYQYDIVINNDKTIDTLQLLAKEFYEKFLA